MHKCREGQLYIGGAWTSPGQCEIEPVLNPATEEVLGYAALASTADAEAALDAARTSFDHGPWRRMNIAERAAVLGRMVDWLEARDEELCALVRIETGSLQSFARSMQFGTGISHARHFLKIAPQISSQSFPLETVQRPDGTAIVGGGVAVREPVGVCAAITPYNVPFMLNIGKVIPALVMGNSVVLKPSPYTPFSALILGEAAEAAGVPAGVFNIVNGGPDIGNALTTDPRVDLVSFTGSDTVGAAIQAQAAPTLKRCLMELGGKSAMIVCADGDVEAAAQNALASLTQHAGQACASMTRLVVHNSVRPAFVARLREMFEAVVIGDPADPATSMGPLIREAARRRVDHMVQAAIGEGVKLVTGGRIPAGRDKGFFYEPTLFDDVDNRSLIAREEAFGPVGVVIGFDTSDEAVAIANDSEFGLTGAVYSKNVGLAYEIAQALRTGKVNINGGSGKMSSYHPFGGIKRSGYGREFGELGLHEFTYVKTIAYRLA